jgi:D-alanyl-D-alanine carboxypeptidase/D-alanyl-D-alanine-endopeptidase (penicillin-binding protein 4)
MVQFYATFLILFCSTLLSAQRISERKLARQIKNIPELAHAFVGVHIESVDDNKVSAQLNEDRYMTPASNTKLLTFLGAVQTFSKLPALEFAIENNRLAHFRSTAYPLLLHPFYPDSLLFRFFKDRPVWKYHVSKTAPTPQGPGWSWDDYNYYFAASRSVFPIYGNSVTAFKKDTALNLIPSFPFQKDSIQTKFERVRQSNTFLFNPQNWSTEDTLNRPFIPSDSLFVKLLSDATLNDISFASQPNDSLPWQTLYTENETSLYKGLLQDSDNGIAEALLLMIANHHRGIFSPEIAIELLKARWENWLPDPLEWVDGSGVSRYNMLTPRSLVAVLKQTEKHVNWETLQILFPKSGSSGTLKAYTQLKDVYAKTGTLRHNHNLSGYWESPKGNRYAFSIMVNHFTAPTAEIRKGISTLLNRIQKKLK